MPWLISGYVRCQSLVQPQLQLIKIESSTFWESKTKRIHDTLLILSSVHHSLLINHKIFDIYLTTKAFRAIAPSSVAFYWQLEQFNITKDPKLRKWKWPLLPESKSGNFHQETHEESTVKKFNWILQFSSPLAPPPLLLPCPKCLLTEAWKASSFGPLVLLLLRWATFITTSEYWAPWAGLLLRDVVDGDLVQEDLSTWMGTTW